ncbi:hypothetical protein GUJ93_ZPchr0009g2114 [Zizania palustris]|uniref:C3H1-type domain-containing protein n=1 Tax=Zizania palustris TaxID=103762 RepID=A0A8J5R887_ZIZPA|nr:hypothetical protein GUJ93_ZPchr0009g2114 [Zizania palustris]
MADADTKGPHKSDPDASLIGSISVSSRSSGAGDAAEMEEQLAGLTIADQEELPKPTGWEDDPVIGGGDGVSREQLPATAEAAAADSRPRFPRRPGELDCTYYVKFGSCRFGMKCKFNHPSRKKKNRVKGCHGGSGSGSNSSSNKPSSPDDEQLTRGNTQNDLSTLHLC